jgi:MFS family permease
VKELFANRQFRLLILIRASTSVALPMLMVAIGWNIYDLTHDPVDLGLVGLCVFLPQMLMTLPAGHAADHFPRKRLLLFAYAMLALSAALLTVAASLGNRDPLVIFAAMPIYALGNATMRPASQSLLPQVVTKEQLPSAVAFSSSSWQTASIVGPAVGGLLYGAGPAFVYGLVASLLVTVMLFATQLVHIQPAPQPDGGAWQKVLAGVHFVRRRPVLLGAISLDLFAVLFGGATALLPVYARDILDAGPTGLGLLRAAPAVGALVCGFTLAHRPLHRRAGQIMFLCVGGFGVATIIFGLSRWMPLSMLALAVLGACDMVSIYVRQTLVQINTPDAMRGRVSAVSNLFIGASNELGEFESGITAGWFGTVPAVVLGGIGTLAVVAIWSMIFPQLRRVDRLDEQS